MFRSATGGYSEHDFSHSRPDRFWVRPLAEEFGVSLRDIGLGITCCEWLGNSRMRFAWALMRLRWVDVAVEGPAKGGFLLQGKKT